LFKAKPQVVPVSRLPPLFVTAVGPPQLVAAVFARMVFFTVALSLMSLCRPELAGAVFPATVTLVSEIVAVPRPEFLTPPPLVLALLPLIVTFVSVALAAWTELLSKPPPPEPAPLPLIVAADTVIMPGCALAIPPPVLPAMLSRIVLSERVRLAVL
jgi:hypothetical protein